MEDVISKYLKLKQGLRTEVKVDYDMNYYSILETYSSFANTCGGVIYLGIKEDNPNIILGVDKLDEIKKDFFTTLNNYQKISKNILKDSDFKVIDINGKHIIEIHVPEANIYDKPIYLHGNVTNSYKRNYEGDFKLNQIELIQMLDDAKVLSKDSLANKKNFGFEVLDLLTLKEFRNDLNNSNPNNIFINESDEDFLVKFGLMTLNQDNKFVLNNAGLLLFSLPGYIRQINPDYFFDYQEKNNLDDETWTNRITTDDIDYVGNLYNFYKRVLKQLITNLPKPFMLEGVKDSGEENLMFMIREAFINALTNANYISGASLKIIKTKDKIVFTNTGKLKIPYQDAIKYGNSDPRNKTLMIVFRNLKLCERGGTGLPKIFNIADKLNLYPPMLVEDSVLNTTTLTIYIKFLDTNKNIDSSKGILNYLKEYPEFISISDLARELNMNRTTVSAIVNGLIDKDIITTNGRSTKGKKIKLK